MRLPAPWTLVPVAALALAGCAATPAADDGELVVIASTSVYGDIAATVVGDLGSVESIITSTTQDPHSYEVTARDRLALEGADLVVSNGGGYDPYIDSVLAAMDSEPLHVVAVAVAGLVEDDHDHAQEGEGEEHAEEEESHEGHHHLEGVNEHVWYDLHVMGDVAHEIAHELGELDPDNADVYEANAEAFHEQLEGLESELAALAERAAGAGVIITEPVPGYLLEEAGFENLTPEGFSEAIEEGTDVPPALLAATIAAVGDAALLANNPQTGGPETEQLLAAAEAAGVPVVDFLELLPEGSTYLEWMRDNIRALSAALP